jgi:hypothetical protein
MLLILSNIETENCIFEYKFCVLLEEFGITIDKIEPLFKRALSCQGPLCFLKRVRERYVDQFEQISN